MFQKVACYHYAIYSVLVSNDLISTAHVETIQKFVSWVYRYRYTNYIHFNRTTLCVVEYARTQSNQTTQRTFCNKINNSIKSTSCSTDSIKVKRKVICVEPKDQEAIVNGPKRAWGVPCYRALRILKIYEMVYKTKIHLNLSIFYE